MLKWSYYLTIIALSSSGAIFYYFQNYHNGLGSSIALPKVFWLGYALWFWYFLPLIICADKRISASWHRLYWISWFNMALRAILELSMMYFSHNWHPYYGIAHDIFSAVLIFGLLFTQQNNINADIDKVVGFNFQTMGAMFLIEAYFAYYMLINVHSDAGAVYFVPGNPEYWGIMLITWLVIVTLTIQQIAFARKWLYEYQLPNQIDDP